MDTLIKRRGALKARVTIFSKYIGEIQTRLDVDNKKDLILNELITRVERFRLLSETFEEIQTEIELKHENLDSQMIERENFEQEYCHLLAEAETIINSNSKQNVNVNAVNTVEIHENKLSNVKLPQIKLPIFNGMYEEWLEFRDTFESLIDQNTTIGEMQKFHYLRASLEGGAAQVIKSIEFTAHNYSVAWELLKERYDNKSLLINNHLKALFSLPPIGQESAQELRELVDGMSKHLRALENLQQPVNKWDSLVIYLICEKLDKLTMREWEESKKQNELPTLTEFKKFLQNKAEILETLHLSDAKGKSKRAMVTTKNTKCFACGESYHPIYTCRSFLDMSVNNKLNYVRRNKLCNNCLKSGHFSKECKSSKCKKCDAMHNTLLHIDKRGNSDARQVVSLTANTMTSQVLLSTVVINIVDSKGDIQNCRAILDSASQSNFMTITLQKRLGLDTTKLEIGVQGVGKEMLPISRKCEATIRSRINAFERKTTFLIIPVICEQLPDTYFSKGDLQIPENIQLADPSFNKPGDIDMILGAELFYNLLCIGQIKLNHNNITLQKTRLGWVVAGKMGYGQARRLTCHLARECELMEQLKKFWEIENVKEEILLSEEDKECEKQFQEKTQRSADGRFIVAIPLKESEDVLGESREAALGRLKSVERRMARDSYFKREYTEFMREYEDLGHMTKLTEEQNSSQAEYYMPHHGILQKSTTTKLRVVFDASNSTSSGLSFNDIQHAGPNILEDLVSIMLRFRQYKFVLCADIQKMYRQILVQPNQRHLQKIVWRETPDAPIDTYCLNTVTYGTKSAPYLAVRCLKQVAREMYDMEPKASTIIMEDFYMDDLVTGGETEEEVIEVAKQIQEILQTACFNLHKWKSNSDRILQQFSNKGKDNEICFRKQENTRTIGLFWNPRGDTLTYSVVTTSMTRCATKRQILSQIAHIYDPLGLVCPVVVTAKLVMQKLWALKLNWDESIPMDLYYRWQLFVNQLQMLNEMVIPRRVISDDQQTVEVHGFADASKEAYGACIYLRSTNSEGTVAVNLVCGKTKVAPLKILTIPRLELCAALMLTQLLQRVQNSLKISINRIVLWSDSTIVLQWLQMPPKALQPFVGHRVAQIQTATDKHTWKHVPTEDNPADALTRGMDATTLKHSELWWHGPNFLLRDESQWPQLKWKIADNAAEMKTQTLIVKTAENLELFYRYSDLSKLIRVVAYMLRFVSNAKLTRSLRYYDVLTRDELDTALELLIKLSQRESFECEIKLLAKGSQVSKQLQSLTPFLDKAGIMRVGGRLRNASLEYNKMHPILLNAKHQLTKLLFKREHARLLHVGPQQLLYSIRERFWPIGGRNLARKTVHTCVTCFRASPVAIGNFMGELPADRVTVNLPFQICGVDYAGPVLLKNKQGRGSHTTKAYICLFVCFVTKAVHIELVTSLSTENFLAALRRFTSRRGKPDKIYSDNGTNFVGASRELRIFFKNNSSKISQNLLDEQITWCFTPAHSPHFGGLWEAGIKSAKYHLKRVVGTNSYTYEGYITILTQIEAILNSRPISPLSSDPLDPTPLTPAHFLVGRSLAALPERSYISVKESRLTAFERYQQIKQAFWARWSKEYISELQQRIKWKSKTPELAVIGAMVVIKEDNLPPLKWQLGRIVDTHPGADGVIRVVSVQLPRGSVVRRNVTKLCVLPI